MAYVDKIKRKDNQEYNIAISPVELQIVDGVAEMTADLYQSISITEDIEVHLNKDMANKKTTLDIFCDAEEEAAIIFILNIDEEHKIKSFIFT